MSVPNPMPKRHHYVPQWHLRRFAVDPRRPRLACYSKTTDRIFVAPIRDLAVIGHYHTWRHDGVDDLIVERGAELLDSRAAEALPKLERGTPLAGTEPNVVAGYLAMQQARVPTARNVFQEVIERIGRDQAELALAEPLSERRAAEVVRQGLAATPEEAESLRQRSLDAVREGRVKITMDHIMTASIGAFFAERVIPILEAMAWLVIEAAPGEEFVISDNPVALFSDGTPLGAQCSYSTPDIEVTMPLSRRTVIMMSHAETASGRACAMPEAMLDLNTRCWLAASDHVFASSEEVLRKVGAEMPRDIRTRQIGAMRLRPADVTSD